MIAILFDENGELREPIIDKYREQYREHILAAAGGL